MVKQKIVLKLKLDDERKKRKAFKAAVGMAGVMSATIEGDKIIIVGDGVDPIALTTMLRRRLGYAELLSVSSGDDKKKDGYGYDYGYGGTDSGGGMSFSGKDSKGGGGGGYHHNMMTQVSYSAYQQYDTVPSYPVYSYPSYHQREHDPGCSIM